ncbi:metallophosphatase [Chroococcus sp. FPU101]|uniref:metallophosphatase n=1 Tax=Chroococcus sp. FPU101 TaxID=1974212 RepID=UPI001A8C1BCF|nr:metallophosphatase [Chroococcus sp. FPU101]GFE68508.1 hypothetical protein CFPU101_11180 [Chroococcus sp. FPU101]
MWAILSGIEGNLTAYEAVLEDLSESVESLYILGDLVGIRGDSDKLIQRVQFPYLDELEPNICLGWWEEQCFILHGIGKTGEPTELIEQYGTEIIKTLWNAVSHESVEWLRGLDFGFVELDLLLIHGSSISVSEALNPQTPAWLMLDRIQRMQVNQLFCGRSGQTFIYDVQEGSLVDSVQTLDHQHTQTVSTSNKRVVGVGNVGKEFGKATYTLYHPHNNKVEFKTVIY